MHRLRLRGDQWDRIKDLLLGRERHVGVHVRHSRWAKTGVWEKIFNALVADADNEYAMIDITIVRAHQNSAGAPKKSKGSSQGGLSTKSTPWPTPRAIQSPFC
jgi:transposase